MSRKIILLNNKCETLKIGKKIKINNQVTNPFIILNDIDFSKFV